MRSKRRNQSINHIHAYCPVLSAMQNSDFHLKHDTKQFWCFVD